MKTTIPWLIAAVTGCVMIGATFIPALSEWKNEAGSWFELLAALAFIAELGATRPENPLLLEQGGALWLRDDSVGGTPVTVFAGPPGLGAGVGASSPQGAQARVRYWVDLFGHQLIGVFGAFVGFGLVFAQLGQVFGWSQTVSWILTGAVVLTFAVITKSFGRLLLAFLITAVFVKGMPRDLIILVQVLGALIVLSTGALIWIVSSRREVHVSAEARARYRLNETLFALSGNVVLANLRAVRSLAAEMTARRRDDGVADATISPGELNALGLVDEVLHAVVGIYREQEDPEAIDDALDHLDEVLGAEAVDATLARFTTRFPPLAVHRGELTPLDYLAGETDGTPNREVALEELANCWLANANPAAVLPRIVLQ